ncbi:MAG: hypothetical protein KatS3mg115_1918 [Candidatus Poribacteria bacterium]|nr:MAG: hypothetical protein KatS3mg115_1918 [Candidatus Poribacteria bacterium]
MALKLRYVLIINAVILTVMGVFFLLDDYRLRRSHIAIAREGTAAGIRAREIAGRILVDVQDFMTPERYISEIRHRLQDLGNESEFQDVLDVRVSLWIDQPAIIASLSGDAEAYAQRHGELAQIELSKQDRARLEEVLRNYGGDTAGIVVGMQPYRGTWATRLLLPFTWDASVPENGSDRGYTMAVGLIEIFFDSSELPGYWESFRRSHLLFLVLFVAVLTLLIEVTTDRMVLRPLEQLTEIIRRAERGEVETDARFPNNELGRVSATLTEMLARLRRLHQERIAALERLASGVAHEIRNPLHTLSMAIQYLQAVLERAKLPPEDRSGAEEVLEIAREQVQQLNRITNQFLSLTRPSKMRWEHRPLGALLDQVLAECSLRLKEQNIRVVREDRSGDLVLPMDVDRLRTAFYNLVQNAIDAMPNGGVLTLRTERRGGTVRVEVEDTGKGIEPETLERIFDPYFTTREQEGGLGLGLTLAQHAVHSHGGEIQVHSQPGVGTTFVVLLPLRPDLTT